MRPKVLRRFQLVTFLYGATAFSFLATAQTPAREPIALRFTAVTQNVSGAGEAIKINVSNWSTDRDRDQVAEAWMLKTSPAPEATAGARGARGGRGGRGADGRGGDAGAALPVDPDAVDLDSPAFRFGRGGARGRGGADAAAPALTPESSLVAALKKMPTFGMFWTSETVGYSIKYAYRLPQPDGSDRIILATDRRVGAWSNHWKVAGSANLTDYAFSIIELRVNPKGEGEGKLSMTGKVAVDSNAKTIALEGYNALPVVLKGVKRHTGNP